MVCNYHHSILVLIRAVQKSGLQAFCGWYFGGSVLCVTSVQHKETEIRKCKDTIS